MKEYVYYSPELSILILRNIKQPHMAFLIRMGSGEYHVLDFEYIGVL
jgi:hypothetical protein